MNRDTSRFLNLVQLISEIGIGVGYLLGLIPFQYWASSAWVIPLVFVSLLISLINGNGTLVFTFTNVVLAFLSYIPVLGYVFRIAGILASWINLRILTQQGGGRSY